MMMPSWPARRATDAPSTRSTPATIAACIANICARDSNHAGIVIVPRQRYSVGEQLRRLLQLINTKTADDMRNHLEFL